MSNDEKKPLKMYPGVSLGSAPQKSTSRIKLFLLIIIVVAGASGGGYWINREFINKEPEVPEVVEIIESDPVPVEVTEVSTEMQDLNLSLDEPSPTAEPESSDILSDSSQTTLTQTESTSSDDDLLIDNILSEESSSDDAETAELTAMLDTSENTDTSASNTVNEEAGIIDETITAVGDTVTSVSDKITETVSDITSSEKDTADILSDIKKSDEMITQGNYKDAAAMLSVLTAISEEKLGKLSPDIFYRAGLANRYLKNENEAQQNWLKAYENYPDTISGRLAALALADTWYYWYVESNQDISKWESIRDAYSTAIGMDGARFLPQATEAKIAEKLNYLNQKLIFDPKMPVSGAVFHKVEPGEYISTIAREYGLGTWTSIIDINKVDPKNLKVGMELKIMPGRMFVLVDKRNFTLSWYLDGKFIKRYGCATGAPESETPVGHYEVFKMDAEPNWTDPKTGKVYKYGEEGHAIGSRWMAIRGGSKTGLGIHGTIYPESIGTKASNGCIRLLNEDVEELYGFASIANNNETEVLVIE